METKSGFLSFVGIAFSLGVAAALLSLLGEVFLSFFSPENPSGVTPSDPKSHALVVLGLIVFIEELSCFSLTRAFHAQLQRLLAPILLGLGFIFIETSITTLLQKQSMTLPSIDFLPIFFIHVSAFALYLSVHRRRIALFTLFLLGNILHFSYNFFAFSAKPFLFLLLFSTFSAIITLSFFLAHLTTPRYTEDEAH